MRTALTRLAVAITASLLLTSPLAALDIGDPAPGLEGLTVVKGPDGAVSLANTFTVVEFWATWCGPCRTSIPHLTQLATANAGHLQVIGISDEPEGTVRPYVDGMGSAMDYTVATAPAHVYQRWMANVPGIPHAYLVGPDGVVYWQGHPLELDPVIAQAMNGELDAEWLAAEQASSARRLRLEQAMQTGDVMLLAQLCEAGLAEDPTDVELIQTRALAARHMGDMGGYINTWRRVPVAKLDAATANGLAWELLMEVELEYRLIDVAYAMAQHAAQLEPDDASVLETWARALAAVGDFTQAVMVSQQAVDLSPGQPELIAALHYYQLAQALRDGLPPPTTDIPPALPIPPLEEDPGASEAMNPGFNPAPTPGGGAMPFIP